MTLAATKRRITVGTKLKLVRHDWFVKGGLVIHGNTGITVMKPRVQVGDVRTVCVAKTTQFALLNTDGRESWLDWPKASCYRDTASGFEIDLNGDSKFTDVMGYEFVLEDSHATTGECNVLP